MKTQMKINSKVTFVSWKKIALRKREERFRKSKYFGKLTQKTKELNNNSDFKKALRKHYKESYIYDNKKPFNNTGYLKLIKQCRKDHQFCKRWKISYNHFILGRIVAQSPYVIRTTYPEDPSSNPTISISSTSHSAIPIQNTTVKDRREVEKIYSSHLDYYYPKAKDLRGRKEDKEQKAIFVKMRNFYKKQLRKGTRSLVALEEAKKKFNCYRSDSYLLRKIQSKK